MKNRIFKISIAVLLVAVMALSLFSCGTSKVEEQSGNWGDFSWVYKDGTLSVTGSGVMPVAENAAKVGWAAVRTAVTKVVFYGDITNVSDYAFYGMSSLTEITLPDTVTSIGKTAFAFCSSLKSINLPNTLTSIGESAFEGCTALEGVVVPMNVTSVGARAFAFCRSLKSIIVSGNISSIGSWTFKECSALETVVLLDTFDKTKISADAFEDAKIASDKISYTTSVDGNVTVTVKYVDEAGAEIKTAETKSYAVGDQYTITAPNTVKDYTITGDLTKKGTATVNETVTFTYKKNVQTEEATDTEAESDSAPVTDKEKKSSTSTIVALVIFGVVILGICVGAFLLIRSDKKQKKNGTTVRKTDNGKNGKNSKNGKRK